MARPKRQFTDEVLQRIDEAKRLLVKGNKYQAYRQLLILEELINDK